MRNLILGSLIALFLTTPVLADTPRADARQERQDQRIDQGEASGELTDREARRLEQQQNHIERSEQRAEADGVVTARERARLERKQDRASRNIHRKKHNRRDER